MRPVLPRPKQHCSVQTEFGYFAGGCFAGQETQSHPQYEGDGQFNQQHQIQEAEDGAEDVAAGVLQKS